VQRTLKLFYLGHRKSELLKRNLEELLALGHIRLSTSMYSASAFLAPKKGVDRCRVLTDFRELNKATLMGPTVLPLTRSILDKLSGHPPNRVFSTLDLASGYSNLLIAEEDRHKTSFLTKIGQFEWCVVAQG
jgi:hypothetical protein